MLVRDAPSELHVAESWHDYELIEPTIDARYRRFAGADAPLPPLPAREPEHVKPARRKHLFGA